MQSYNDLNNFSSTSVSYNSQSDYSITPGTSLGDTTVTAVEGSIEGLVRVLGVYLVASAYPTRL
jgi:hypothetical protein